MGYFTVLHFKMCQICWLVDGWPLFCLGQQRHMLWSFTTVIQTRRSRVPHVFVHVLYPRVTCSRVGSWCGGGRFKDPAMILVSVSYLRQLGWFPVLLWWGTAGMVLCRSPPGSLLILPPVTDPDPPCRHMAPIHLGGSWGSRAIHFRHLGATTATVKTKQILSDIVQTLAQRLGFFRRAFALQPKRVPFTRNAPNIFWRVQGRCIGRRQKKKELPATKKLLPKKPNFSYNWTIEHSMALGLQESW